MKKNTDFKSTRMLAIYDELLHGRTLGRKELADRFHVTERSIQRDMEVLRFFIVDQSFPQKLI